MGSNIPNNIRSKIGYKLHNMPDHPINIVKKYIQDYFMKYDESIKIFDELDPIVSVDDNFDKLLIPIEHPSRSRSDTYYVDDNYVLRTHTTAHQNKLLSDGVDNFLVTGDVYRKDEIDRFHYPIFHQMEGVLKINLSTANFEEIISSTLGKLVEYLFPNCSYEIKPDYFPFTENSYEIEVVFDNKLVEVLGCGFIHKKIKENNNLYGTYLAFGLGLDRLAMILFKIPDIRYMWSLDDKFLSQFSMNKFMKDKNNMIFIPFSNLCSVSKDISFYIPSDNKWCDEWVDENNFFEIIRDIASEYIESVTLCDKFYNKKINKISRMYRLTFSPTHNYVNPAEFNKKCIDLSEEIRCRINVLNVELR